MSNIEYIHVHAHTHSEEREREREREKRLNTEPRNLHRIQLARGVSL